MTYDFVCPRDFWIDYPRPLSGLSGHAAEWSSRHARVPGPPPWPLLRRCFGLLLPHRRSPDVPPGDSSWNLLVWVTFLSFGFLGYGGLASQTSRGCFTYPKISRLSFWGGLKVYWAIRIVAFEALPLSLVRYPYVDWRHRESCTKVLLGANVRIILRS